MMVSLVPSSLAIFRMEAGNYGKEWTCIFFGPSHP